LWIFGLHSETRFASLAIGAPPKIQFFQRPSYVNAFSECSDQIPREVEGKPPLRSRNLGGKMKKKNCVCMRGKYQVFRNIDGVGKLPEAK
jgi:hypothetical protein